MLTARIDSERNQQLPLDDPFRLTCIEPRNGYDYPFFDREVDRAIASGSTVFFLLHTVQEIDGLQDMAAYLDERHVWCPTIDEWYKTMVAQAETTPWVGRYAYVTTGDGGVQAVDIGDPAAPTVVGGYDTSGTAGGVDVKDSIALVADGGSGLQAVDQTDPASPALAGTFDTAGSAKGVAVERQPGVRERRRLGPADRQCRRPSEHEPRRRGRHAGRCPSRRCVGRPRLRRRRRVGRPGHQRQRPGVPEHPGREDAAG